MVVGAGLLIVKLINLRTNHERSRGSEKVSGGVIKMGREKVKFCIAACILLLICTTKAIGHRHTRNIRGRP